MITRTILTGLMLMALGAALAPAAAQVDLSDIRWETNLTDPPIGDPNAQKGGTLYTDMRAYPLSFRVVGPNSNDAFASWKRAFTQDFTLVKRHPTTDNFIPWMATHWSVQDDGRTIFFKLDPDARWSDGEPITADDYVFSFQMLQSDYIVDPFWASYIPTYYESVERLDDHTLKVVGKFPSWRPLNDFNLFPTPQHVEKLGPDWVEEANNVPTVNIGPYVITDRKTNQYIVYERIQDWWGEDKHYFQGMWNPDKIYIKVIQDPDRALDYFKKGELSYLRIQTAKKWAQEMDFDGMEKGWAHRKRVFVDFPQGLYGFAMNLQKPIFQNKDFRKAVQYLFNFDQINEELMFNAYYRSISAFEGTEYENPNLAPYGFDPRKAREHLQKAGYRTRGGDGILVDDAGNRASFTFTYGQPGLQRHMTVQKQIFQRFGVEMNLRLLEAAAAFELGLERQYEMTMMSRTTLFYPGPHQYFASEFIPTTNNNNIWAFGTAHTDSLIDVFRFDLDKSRRVQAMHELDAIIQDEAFYVPFWQAPFARFVYWDNVGWPDYYVPLRFEQFTDFQLYWIDEERDARLRQAMQNGEVYGEDPVIDVDPYGVKAKMDAMISKAAGESPGL